MSNEKPLKEGSSVLEESDVRRFIESRKIRPEDFYILEELAKISKRALIMDFHNFFTFNKERSGVELERSLTFLKTVKEDSLIDQRIKLNRLLADFIGKYDWTIAWNLVSVFERRK